MNKQTYKWLKRAVVIAVIGATVVAANALVTRAKSQQAAAPRFKTIAIERGPITQMILASGSLQPVNTVSVGVQVSGTVADRLADFNQRVRTGQVLLRLDPVTFKARIRETQALLASAEASLALANSTAERNERLLLQGFIADAARDRTRQDLDVARANVEVARAKLASAQADLNNSIVRSPIDGIVVRRSVDVGQTVAASFQTPELFRIVQDLRHMLIHANVSEADVGQIKVGQAVRFDVDAWPGREFEGHVKQFRLDATTTSGVVTYDVVIAVDNADERLKPGMTANTRIVVATKPDALRVPTAALRFKPDEDELAPGAPVTADTAVAPTSASDDGNAAGRRPGQARIYRVYTVSTVDGGRPRALPHDVTIGLSNTRFTELVSHSFKVGDPLILRRLDVSGVEQP